MLTQLNPQIPVWVVNKGAARAIAVIDYSCEDHLIWVCAMDESGEIWSVPNPQVRLQKNFSLGRAI